MRKPARRISLPIALSVSVFCLTAFSMMRIDAAVAAPEYKPVAATLYNQRDGLGNVLAKLKSGKPVKIAYLGGSITAAAGWRIKTREWFASQYPQATVEEIHAAIGGTGSDLGVFRVHRDALRHNPDLLFVEFAVNDGGAAPERIWPAMEGIVRQTWAHNSRCDICFVYTFRVGYEKELREGLCPRAASADEMLAEHYGIPSINLALRTVEMETAGKLIFKGERDEKTGRTKPDPQGRIVFSVDGVHPQDAGHQIYTDLIADAVLKWREDSKPIDHAAKLARPFVEDHWQAAKIVDVEPSMLEGGWTKLPQDTGLGQRFGSRMDTIWEASQPGQKLRFRFRGSTAKLYDLLGPDGGQVVITVDGKTNSKPVPRFDSYCTYHRIATLSIAQGLDPDQVHEVVVEVHPEQPDRRSVAFRLKDPEKELKEPKFQGTKLWVGGILLIGDLAH